MPTRRPTLTFALLTTIVLSLAPLAAAHAAAAPAELSAETRQAVDRAIASVLPALVRIHVVEVDYQSGREMKSEATGSGVIFTPEGHIITNHHVAGHAKHLVCKLVNKEEIDADLVGTDPLTDIAVIKLRPKTPRQFPIAPFGDSSTLRVGDPVLAMGSPVALSQSVTMGIVSNTALVVPDLFWPFKVELEGEDVGSIVRWIGHDAEINPGNSGGPLVDLNGEVVGINEIQLGLGGAIPADLARPIAEQLIKQGRVERAWLGIDIQPMLRSRKGEPGVLIGGPIAGSPAEKAGFQPGDVLLAVNGQEVSVSYPEELPSFNQFVADLPIGKPAAVVVLRDGKQVTLTVVPDSREAARPREREFTEWGMTGRDLSLLEAQEMRRKTKEGVLVTSIRSGGPCEEARPRVIENDVIIAVRGSPVRTANELADATSAVTANAKEPVPVLVLLDRKAEQYLTVVKVGKKPVPEPAGEASKAWLGINTQVLTREMAEALQLKDTTGVRVTQVLPGTSAGSAGLRVGDLIVGLAGQKIPAFRPEHFDVFPALVRQYDIGAQVELTILRDGKEDKLPVVLDPSPKMPREMKTYRDDRFEFMVRDVADEDRFRQQLPKGEQGVLVESVTEGGWAALAHLGVGDLVLKLDGQPVPSVAAFAERMKQVAAEKPESVVFYLRRGIHTMYVELQPKWADAASAAPQQSR
jgi:serine protease Do